MGARHGMYLTCFSCQTFINSSVLLMSLMALQHVNVDQNTFGFVKFQTCHQKMHLWQDSFFFFFFCFLSSLSFLVFSVLFLLLIAGLSVHPCENI